jgi:chemotaxis protein CheD
MRERIGVVAAARGRPVHLLAGQLVFGPGPVSVRTLLGSCVALTVWHPQQRIGGMCHYMLPNRARTPGSAFDGRFGDEAMATIMEMMDALGTRPGDYEATLSGGADTMGAAGSAQTNIGERNIELGWMLIDRCGFQLNSVDVGDDVPRTVTLDLTNGAVQIRRGQPIVRPPLPAAGAARAGAAAPAPAGQRGPRRAPATWSAP